MLIISIRFVPVSFINLTFIEIPEFWLLICQFFACIGAGTPHQEIESNVFVTAAAFVDNSNNAVETKEDFAQQMQIMYDFQFYNTVDSNVSKMAIIAVNAPNAMQTMKWPNVDDIKVKMGSEREQLLGNWFSGNNKRKIGHKMIENTINDTCRCLKTNTITDKTAIYILNRVLLPKVLYMVKMLAITHAQMDLWYAKAVKVAKQKAGLAKSTATSILEHPIVYGYENWRHVQANALSKAILDVLLIGMRSCTGY
ncbi:hypothetical protein HDU98_012084 [Podochytrium sp. JEL0797]|nr:hypothetical protein HDU98_012084 [Podochytrium sp. JEL0797]